MKQIRIIYSLKISGISCNGSFVKSMDRQISQGNRALNALLYKAIKLRLPTDLVLELFDRTIVPIVTYGCEVWGFEDLERVEIFHRKFLKRLMGVGYSTSNCFAYGECGRSDLRGVILSRMVGFWLRLRDGKPGKIAAMLLMIAKRKHYDMQSPFRSSWVGHLDTELENLGLSHIWAGERGAADHREVKALVKERSHVKFLSEWNTELNQRPFCYPYRAFKTEFKLEKYLVTLPFHLRRQMARFRCRSNYLPVASFMRHFDPNFVPQCPWCANANGDEPHYLFRCPHFAEKRREWLGRDPAPGAADDERIFVQHMQTEDHDKLMELSRFMGYILDVVQFPPAAE